LGSWGLADQYLLSKQPSQLGFLPPEGVNDIDRGLCHFRLLIVRAFLVGLCLAVSPGHFQQCLKAASESIRIPKGRGRQLRAASAPRLTSCVRLTQPILNCVILRAVVPRPRGRVGP